MRYYATTDHDGCPYITAGKRYEIEEMNVRSFLILCDDPTQRMYCSFKNCAHIDYNNWKIGIIREDK